MSSLTPTEVIPLKAAKLPPQLQTSSTRIPSSPSAPLSRKLLVGLPEECTGSTGASGKKHAAVTEGLF
jgi:hypothetical protein